jgi:glycosyltransferase involved in cell wall biosynthesis
MLREIINAHDRFILLAPPNKDELKYFVGDYMPDKVTAIPNSIPSVFPAALTKKEKVILHVSRLNVPQKRSDLLLNFWISCYKELPDWTFLIVGDGPYKDVLKEDIRKKGIPRIEMKGFQKPEPYYEKASIFMMPSAFEGFPNTILEAQSFGCVPFAFNSYAALEWIVNNDQDAKLIPPFETDTMGKEVVNLIQNKNNLKTMQEASIRNASKFTIDQVGYYWKDLFDTLNCGKVASNHK